MAGGSDIHSMHGRGRRRRWRTIPERRTRGLDYSKSVGALSMRRNHGFGKSCRPLGLVRPLAAGPVVVDPPATFTTPPLSFTARGRNLAPQHVVGERGDHTVACVRAMGR